ncbi:Serine/threonine-protein kinase PSK2 [Escovopsis weberi]|uniref:non-specific serine/threonine protein kinase n=1 Tax=Escovopsis weberi TaxID=150374 RepID=A0A0M8MQA5_ESCWE|nr:Serine/threonine-protein kinase PSK2 [Escovopsis weberi]
MSFDPAANMSADHDSLARPPQITEHEHGAGLSGLRRIRQQHPSSRTPTVPSSTASSRSPSVVALSRSTSFSAMLNSTAHVPAMPGPHASPNFAEDLSRFPSESLHSFSFAHQSEDFLHNRQNVLKRTMEFMKDRRGYSMTSAQAGLASAQARIAGDVDAQNMLDLLARAHVVGASNLPNHDPSSAVSLPLTGPASTTTENPFERHFLGQKDSARLDAATGGAPKSSIQFKEEGLWPEKDEPSTPARSTQKSEESSRTPTAESRTTADTSPPSSRPSNMKRTMTDTLAISLQDRLMDTMSQPFLSGQPLYEEPLPSPTHTKSAVLPSTATFPSALGPAVHGHTNRWVPAAQAIFTTESKPPWTILAANDLACLVFGVTRAEVRKMGILEVVQEERRAWLERKLLQIESQDTAGAMEDEPKATPAASAASALLGGSGHHRNSLSRGVLLCGDVVPIQKRNGATGSASLWVKEKRVGLIWVLEEILEDTAVVKLNEEGDVEAISGAIEHIWGLQSSGAGFDVAKLIPRIPRQGMLSNEGEIDFAQTTRRKYFTCPNCRTSANIPCSVQQIPGRLELRVSTFPHMAGIVVVDPDTLTVRSSNPVFSGALFGYEKPDGLSINALIPDFDKVLDTLIGEDGLQLLDGMVIPEHRFRRASAFLALKEQRPDAAAAFLQPEGIPARHRDGSELKIDVQMRVVESEKHDGLDGVAVGSDDGTGEGDLTVPVVRSELVFALWITYSRHLHAARLNLDIASPTRSEASTPLHRPSPGQTPTRSPMVIDSDSDEPKQEEPAPSPSLTQQLKDVALNAAAKITGQVQTIAKTVVERPPVMRTVEPAKKTTIDDYAILEEMGQGAYGQVKLARHRQSGKKVVLKYVTKRRILVDTWTRDRKLGTVPLEIHVLDYLRRPEFRHTNIVEMQGFFEDDVNYYIEMEPHGLPGMDLFDYIELRANMDESECRSLFYQVVKAVHFLHTIALVVHRDIKDENVILDGEGNIKLIDFGSAAYIKNGPFEVFVGTIDYAAPEVLAGKAYGGKEQDVWALGILLYTIIYKENPFYSIDEIMDRDLRVPFKISDESIDLVRCMLNRDVEQRFTIEQVLDHPWFKNDM